MPHICVSKLTIVGADNGLLPGQYQAIIWTNAEILMIGPLGTNFSEILIEIFISSFKKMHFDSVFRKFATIFILPPSKFSDHETYYKTLDISAGCMETVIQLTFYMLQFIDEKK